MIATAANWYVDDDNQTGTTNGTILEPFSSIQIAIDNATSGDSVSVADGSYAENLTIADKAITLYGAFTGGTSADYASGRGGDFVNRFVGNNSSSIIGQASAATILIQGESSGTSIDGFTITGGHHGIELPDWPINSNLNITNNRIQGNGLDDPAPELGGGILLYETNHTNVESNLIMNNRAGRGAGIAGGGSDLSLIGNRIIENEGVSDHGGGAYLWGTGVISNNHIAENRVGEELGYGWGGGLIIFGGETEMTISGNRFTGNMAPSAGAGVFIDDGATVHFDHNLVYRNQTSDWLGGAAFYVDCLDEHLRSRAFVSHSTFVRNGDLTQAESNAIVVECSDLEIENSILWGHAGNAFFVDGTSNLRVNHSLIQSGWSELLPDDQGGYVTHPEAWPGDHNLIDIDPLFANLDQDDFHLRSAAGRWHAMTSQWVTDSDTSPAIDAANPASPYANEPLPSGGRANLGAYGNSLEASLSTGDEYDVCEPGLLQFESPDVFGVQVIRSESEIITLGSVTLHPGSSVLFQAAQRIRFGQGFQAQAGARFQAVIQETTCPSNRLRAGPQSNGYGSARPV
ncbi:MAG: hypothetical protein C1943_05235 [Halochromatium sp.]|nr:hypothetical protein [Halochromatium sp.]